MVKSIDIYLVSSTLHFFWAFMLAKRFEDKRDSHLILIDQYSNRPMQLWSYLTPENTPFISQTKLEGRELGGFKKLRNRYKQFNWVSDFIKNNDVNRVWIGNDRSVLGQWFIKEAKQKNASSVACFMDDGVFSYLGRSASQSFSERYLDAYFKKIIYGFWYDSPITVGASKWIDQAWVMYPEQVNTWLKKKKLKVIFNEKSNLNNLTSLSDYALKSVGLNKKHLESIDVLITLPNESLFSKIPNYEEEIHGLIEFLQSKKIHIAVKYHPAAGETDPLQLLALGLIVIPSNISFELMLPYIKNSTLIGDLSTTILVSHFLQIDKVIMIKLQNDRYSNLMEDLCKNIGLSIFSTIDLKDALKATKLWKI